jgi:nucleotide-binding universal stress UspA family protein
VVGVDGSASSKEALRWALAQARLTGAQVHAVTAWQYPPAYDWSIPVPVEDFASWADKALGEALDEVAGPDGAREVHRTVAQGNAAQALLEAARGADLLVVGNRGHGGFTEALLGSVSQHCVQHAACPVVVIRGRG